MSKDESVGGHDVDRIALAVVDQIQQQVQAYEGGSVSHSNAYDLEQIELQIQAKRIGNILETNMNHIELALLLPSIFEADDGAGRNELIRKEWNGVCDRIQKTAGKGDTRAIHAEMSACIESASKCIPSESIDQHRGKLTDSGTVVLSLLRELKYFAEHKMLMSAAKEMAKQKVLHRMWMNNDSNVRNIKRICGEIEMEKRKFETIIAEKREEIQLLERSREILLTKNSTQINEKIIESNRKMQEICERRKAQHQAAEKVISEGRQKLQRMMENDLVEEKSMTEKKNDLERQLKEFIEKYDREIGARNQRLHECNEQLQHDRETLADWKAKYESQEIIYNQIIADKEIEETREREEKLLLFMMNRAALIIQRAYRKILSKRKGKKKKGKKGKK